MQSLAREWIGIMDRNEPRSSAEGDPFFHGSAVAFNGSAALLIGPSGSGKSALALDLISRGASLVADDRLRLAREGESLWARPREGFEGRIEARGVGLLSVPALAAARVVLVVDLAQQEPERLPPKRRTTLLGVTLPLLYHAPGRHFSAAMHLLLSGKGERDD